MWLARFSFFIQTGTRSNHHMADTSMETDDGDEADAAAVVCSYLEVVLDLMRRAHVPITAGSLSEHLGEKNVERLLNELNDAQLADRRELIKQLGVEFRCLDHRQIRRAVGELDEKLVDSLADPRLTVVELSQAVELVLPLTGRSCPERGSF
jgi:hypothetical protein